MVQQFGVTEPRLWTPPLRPLTPETTRGFEVIEFARRILGVSLYPWQQWLLMHGLELMPDGQYRFRRVIVLVARQQGKTMLASVLAAWWLFVDSRRHPDRVPPFKFKVVGVAQNLDIAREPWRAVKAWSDPDPATPEEAALALPDLQAATTQVLDTNGKESIFARHRAHYEIRAARHARGKPAARVLIDELREQKGWDSWASISQTTKAFWSNQIWAISNAGDHESVVLWRQREVGLAAVDAWHRLVESGVLTPDEYAREHDVSVGFFEWSAPDGCDKTDVDAILQANPSIGYGAVTVADCLSEAASMPDAQFRTEVLCQWVPATVAAYLDIDEWRAGIVPPLEVDIAPGSRTVWAVDVSHDRRWTWVAAATHDTSGRPVVQVLERRRNMLWSVDYLRALATESGQWEVALRSRGCAVMELVRPLAEAGFTVHEVDGGTIGLATGRFRDRVREGVLRHPPQPLVDLAVEGAVTKRLAENEAWDAGRSVLDIAGLIAESVALYGLEACAAEPVASAYASFDVMTF